jgi:hypothetical protein
MPESKKRPTLIFRITHYNNLEFTLLNGIYCSNSKDADANYINIGHRNLIDKRGRRVVPLSPFGVLNDYVPFYFAPKSPMLYSIFKNNIDGFSGSQKDVIYLVSSIETIKDANKEFVFTDGHAYELISKFYNKLNDLNKIDWKLMGEKYWHNTESDNDRMRKRMAEFLVYQLVPVNCILAIVVYNDKIKSVVDSIQDKCNTGIKILIKPNWYYD